MGINFNRFWAKNPAFGGPSRFLAFHFKFYAFFGAYFTWEKNYEIIISVSLTLFIKDLAVNGNFIQ